MKMILAIIIAVALLLALVVGVFSWANQPTSMGDTAGGSRLGTAFIGSSGILFFGVVILIGIVKLKHSGWM